MCGRIRIAEPCRAIDFQTKTARGSLAIAVAQVAEPPRIAGPVEQLCVFQSDLAGLTRCDGKHPRANQSLAGELDQRGIAFLAHDRFVDSARLRRVHRLAAQLLIALPERVAGEHGLARKREVVHPLVERRAVVPEPFFDCHTGHPTADADLNGAAKALDSRVGLGDRPDGVDPALSDERRRERAEEGGNSQHTKGLHDGLR